VDVEQDAEVPVVSQLPLEGVPVGHHHDLICVRFDLPSSKEPRWLISSVLGWLGRIKLEELRLSEVTGWGEGYMRFRPGRCPRRFRPASCRTCR
jgi:hypothetical protein